MPVEWKTTRVGDTVVHHWKRHNPREILAALRERPIETKGETPQVRRYKFGKLNLAVRQLPRSTDYDDETGKLFANMKRMQCKHVPIVEVPVAIIKEPANVFKVVTIWKKGTTTLGSWRDRAVNDSRINLKQVNDVASQVARKVAQLHAAGYTHGHLKMDNFVITNSGVAMLVDFTKLQKATKQVLLVKREVDFSHWDLEANGLNVIFKEFAKLQVARLKLESKTESSILHSRALDDLWSEYREWYKYYTGTKKS